MQNQQLELFNKNKSFNLKEKKEIFLRSIISKNSKSQNKYKRVALSTIRYAGGKSLAKDFPPAYLIVDKATLLYLF